MQGLRRSGGVVWRRVLCAALSVAVGSLAGCHRPVSGDELSVKTELLPQPARIGPEKVTIRLADEQGRPVPGALISVEADMAHPGMAPVFGQASERAPGQYEGTVDFNMGGDWALLLHIALPGGHKVERQIDVKGVQ